MILFFGFCFSLTQQIEYSTPYDGVIKYTANSHLTDILMISYPKIMFPYLRKLKCTKGRVKLYKIKETDKNLFIFVIIKGDTEFFIYYTKELYKTWEYPIKIESGFIIDPIIQIKNSCKIHKSDSLIDNIYVPDFTVPFIAFSTFGSIFTLLFNFFVKNRINKDIIRNKKNK
ncbi:hypothetical protein TCON_0995 [Astathelohania contejeani]|uniref:Uncharacterized protein n=1 Tax=Astathelohania contejeani TaxID=164912 RepID=A0ABQ7I012_9MICR|nr:hypothetical protein TCON_0995 [Thelohania contejeani]